MKNLKTFEAFFNVNVTPSREELIKLTGIDIDQIKDLLVDFEDKLPWIHISIDFYFITEDTTQKPIEQLVSKNSINFFNLNVVDIKEIKVMVRIHPNEYHLNDLEQKLNSGVIKIKNNNWAQFVLGDIDLSEEIETLKERLELLGFYGFNLDIRTPNDLIRNINFYLNLITNIDNVSFGISIFNISFKKRYNIK